MENIIELINEAGVKFLEPLTVDATYATIVEEAKKLVKAEYGSILLDQDGKLVRVYASDPFLETIMVRDRGFTYDAFKNRAPHVKSITDIEKVHPEIKAKGIKSTIFIPLFYRSKSLGVLSLDSLTDKKITKSDLSIYKLFGSIASLAIRKTELYAETQKALETRDLFISLASHELRTPLTSLNGYVQLLYSKLGKEETSEGRWTRELYEESGRLTSLVKELLEINRIKQGQLQYNLRECSLGEIVAKAVERSAFLSQERTITFTNDVPGGQDLLIADSDKILQMVTGLKIIDFKYTTKNTTVSVLLSEEKGSLLLIVKDEGEGIRQEDLPHVFEEFYKGINSKQKEEQGMGVGLLLARHIVNYHKGTIAISSTVGEGTEVKVKLPKVEYE
jgi:K+-sensing histidine kinase KdpD